MISKDSKILVTGSTGMLGNEIAYQLKTKKYKNLLLPSRKQLDLFNKEKIEEYFYKNNPEYVFMIAAKVGGIQDNINNPISYLQENLLIQSNLFEICKRYLIKKNIFIGSSCIYPKKSKNPIKEKNFFKGEVEETNEAYALAKIVGIKQSKYYYEKYNILTIMPLLCNIYGHNDNYNLNKGHAMASLIKKIVDAKLNNIDKVEVWGTGIARREYIHVKDAASAIIFLFEKYNSNEIINVGTGKDISISELVKLICKISKYNGRIMWNKKKPNGILRKCLDVTKLNQLGFKTKIDLEKGIKKTIKEYHKKLN